MSELGKYYYCNVVGETNVGRRRPSNEDWFGSFECDNGLVAIVCDGMGGHVGGATASHIAVETMERFLKTTYFPDPCQAIIEACNAANTAILKRTEEEPSLAGMGSTCVMLIVRDGKVWIGSVGDSRIYLVRNHRITQLTKDQSYVQMLVDSGELTPEQAEHHPRKNEILNALGFPTMQPATTLPDPILPEAGDCFILCSDGLSGMVDDHHIEKIAGNQTGMSQSDRVSALIEEACRNGGVDNITCQIVEFAVTPGTRSTSDHLSPRFRHCVAALLCVFVLGGTFLLWEKIKNPNYSLYVKDQMNKPYTKTILRDDTLFVKAGESPLQIEEMKDLGIYVHFKNKHGMTGKISIPRPNMKADSVIIMPDSNFTSQSDSVQRAFVFNEVPFESPDISLTFHDGDSTFLYVFPVMTGQDVRAASGESLFYKALNRLMRPKEKLDVTFQVPNQGTKQVYVISGKGRNNATCSYTSHKLKKSQDDIGWCSYNSVGDSCVITVICDSIGTKSTKSVDIPLNDTVFIVRFKTQ